MAETVSWLQWYLSTPILSKNGEHPNFLRPARRFETWFQRSTIVSTTSMLMREKSSLCLHGDMMSVFPGTCCMGGLFRDEVPLRIELAVVDVHRFYL